MSDRLVCTILGCGSSGGVPRIGGDWGACAPLNPKNTRRRCSLLVERIAAGGGRTTILVDTGPDMRAQLLDAKVGDVDAVRYTHAHADHIHGIDDLRGLALRNRRRIDVYCDQATSERLHQGFSYCFYAPPGSLYPPILKEHRLTAGEPVTITGAAGPLTAVPFEQIHGDIRSLGFRFADAAYSSDLNALPRESHAWVEHLDLWILDALRYRSHASHLSVADALELIARFSPKRAVLTNMHLDLDHATLAAELPPHVEPAHDMMRLELELTA
jgi:phosphoribosyl 1,2-cyclic phosphate phosphodiesterase